MSRDNFDDFVRGIQSFSRSIDRARRNGAKRYEREQRESLRNYQESRANHVENENSKISQQLVLLDDLLRDGLLNNFSSMVGLFKYFGTGSFSRNDVGNAPPPSKKPGIFSILLQKYIGTSRPAPLFDETKLDFSGLRLDNPQRNPSAVIGYFEHMLLRDQYPPGFPLNYKIEYLNTERRITIIYLFPDFDIVPALRCYKYIKSSDAIKEVARPLTERRSIYLNTLAMITLRVLNALFKSDAMDLVDTIEFRGYIHGLNKSTGQRVKSYLITLQSSRSTFTRLNLSNVEPLACIQGLNASICQRPEEYFSVI